MSSIIVSKTHPAILIDNSYYIFNRYFATVSWFKQRQENFELNHENIIENKEFIIAFIKHFEADVKNEHAKEVRRILGLTQYEKIEVVYRNDKHLIVTNTRKEILEK